MQTTPKSTSTTSGSILLCILLTVVSASSGCQLIYPGRLPDGPQPNVPQEMPREQSKVTFPDYIIEPPDILTIEAVSLVPKAPYQLRVFDVLVHQQQWRGPSRAAHRRVYDSAEWDD